MINDFCNGASVASSGGNRRPHLATGQKAPERTCWELLGWAVLEQAVDDLANVCRWGILRPEGKCLRWPTTRKFISGYWVNVNVTIAAMRGPNDHQQLKAWFLSEAAKEWCDLIGCRLDPLEIFTTTLKNHSK
jgi:hypothetical protein